MIDTLPPGIDNPIKYLKQLQTFSENFWLKKGEKRVLKLFQYMSRRVPAYKDFLKKNHLDADKIKTIEDFKHVPLIDKDNYLRVYPREKLCWDGEFATKQWMISATSGSTGEPFYFPREKTQNLYYALTAELYLRSNFEIQKHNTLYINCFPLGVWIGGMFTYEALTLVRERGKYNLSIITPGISKLEIIKAVKNLGSHFDQIIIGCYAPFLKDVIDDGVRYGVNWKRYKLRFIFSAEVVSETFRDYLIRITGLTNPYRDSLNHYGTVDLGTMSQETPIAILLRRMGLKNKLLYEELFGQVKKLPTLTQYNPEHFYFENLEGNLLCSSYSGLPLVRYNLKDHGGIFSLKHILYKCKMLNIDLYSLLKQNKLSDTLWNLPFVYVYERGDFSVSFFAFQIYTETIRKALENKSVEKNITGKFTMRVNFDKSGQQIFEVNVELKYGVNETHQLNKTIRELILEQLLKESSEYRKTYEEYGSKIHPKIVCWQYEDEIYFKPGTKQKWVKKSK